MSENKDEGMSKYGVQIDEEKVKTAEGLSTNATDLTKCPWCHQKLDSMNPPHCREHGTEPWEKR